jgi:hypothetical protein
MKVNDAYWTPFLDPEYSVLGLPRGLGGQGIRYLDFTTGWQGSRWVWAAPEPRPRRVRLK